MELQRTLTDPGALIEPLSLTMPLELDADKEMLEYICNENEKDRQHIVGKLSDFKRNEVAVAPEILAKYTGTYVLEPGAPFRGVFKISSENGALMVESNVGGKQQLIALSQTHFVVGGVYIDFVTDDQEMASHLIVALPPGNFRADRQR
jgi:hypothetical protein